MKKTLIALALLGLVALPLLIIRPASNSETFAGSDAQAQALIEKTHPSYRPWFRPVWQPPSEEVSTLLFSLQAAFGAGIVGYYLGFIRGVSTTGRNNDAFD